MVALIGACLLGSPLAGAKHETWLEARSPNFIVVTNSGEKQARKTAIQFEQIRALFRMSIPTVGAHPSPVITILAVKDEESLRALLPEYWAKGHSHPAGFFNFRMNQYYAAVELDAQGTNPYETIYHEYYHSVTLPYFPNLPLWVAEGLADFYGNTQIGDKDAGMGYPDPELIAELKEGQFIPLETLFKVDHSSPYYNEQNKTSLFYAESWALVHYLMVGDRSAHKQKFVDYLTALSTGATQDEAAAKAFGDLKRFQTALRYYIGSYSFFYMRSPAPPKLAGADLKVRELSEAEVDAYRGGFMAARGRTQDAKQILQEALRLDPKLALAFQNLGLADFVDGQPAKALSDVSEAISLDPKNGLTRFLRAYLSFRGSEPMNDPQIESDLRAAIAASPEFAPSYSLLAVYLAAGGESLPEALSFAQKAIALEPGNGSYQLSLAQVLARMKRYDEAQIAALRAQASAESPEKRAQVDSFLTYMRQARSFQDGQVNGNAVPTNPSNISTKGSEPARGNSEASEEIGLQEASGEVTKASCQESGPMLEIKTDSGIVRLHSPTGGGVQIMTMFTPPMGFDPCKSLNGANVTVEYKPDDAKGLTGTVEVIRIAKMATTLDGVVPRVTYRPNARPGETTTAEGKVTDLTCAGNEMQVSILVGGATLALHARDYGRIDVEEEVGFETGEFNPCKDLKGKNASISFVIVEHERYVGEIQRIEVEK